jgi:hypothetical protein
MSIDVIRKSLIPNLIERDHLGQKSQGKAHYQVTVAYPRHSVSNKLHTDPRNVQRQKHSVQQADRSTERVSNGRNRVGSKP